MDPEMLSMLCTPDSHEPLQEASPELIAKVNAEIASGSVKNAGGIVVSEALDEALVASSGKTLYPVRNGIPVLLQSESIALNG